MKRELAEPISLDGMWDFIHAGPEPARVRRALVPAPWQSQFADLRMKSGIGVYGRQFDVPRGWRVGRVYVHFGAVFHNSRVWVNDQFVGANEGGFLPFSFDISECVREGRNEIKVRVESPTDDPTQFPDFPLGEIPFGKQSWYGPLSGIWQSVYLECRNVDHVAKLRLWPSLDNGTLGLRVLLATPATSALVIEISVIDWTGAVSAAHRQEIAAGAEELEVAAISVPNVRPWSVDDPKLYRVRVALIKDAEVVDVVVQSCGFRTFEARDGRFWLNGKPFHLRAALDQDYYPDTICTLPSLRYAEDQLRKAKSLGLNCVRLHIKAPDPRYLDAADRVGILVWAELPNGGVSTERSRARKERLIAGMVDRDHHHPSIVIWTIINENWGVDLVHDKRHRAWLRRTFDWLKGYDPSRLVVDNSPLYPSFHLKTDIADYHFYAAIPDSRKAWNSSVDDLAARGPFLFSPDNDAEPTGVEPLLCSEFGNWGLPDPKQLLGPDGREPWWFETGHDWGGGVMYPHGIENRYVDWHLDEVWGPIENLITASQWRQFDALKYQIERMRSRRELAGYVITELTDVHWEANGLLDMRRHPRVFHHDLARLNVDTLPVARLERWSFWAGERLTLPVTVAHAGPPLAAGVLRVTSTAGAAAFELAELKTGASIEIEAVLDAPAIDASRIERIDIVVDRDRTEVARNWVDIAIHPPRTAPDDARTVWSSDLLIVKHLRNLGYALADDAAAAELILERSHDATIANLVREGKSLLLVADTEMPLYPFFPHWQNVAVEMREGTPWQGDWASSFSWLRRQGPFAKLPGASLLGLSFDRVIPTHVISGCNRHDFQSRVHAGLFVGWIHKPVALSVERAYGSGRFLATTFRLFRDAPLVDPTATLLLDALVEKAMGARRAEAAA